MFLTLTSVSVNIVLSGYRVSVQVTAGTDWAAWHFPGGPIGPPARWAAPSNVAGGSGTEEGAQRTLASDGWLYSDKLFVGDPGF